MISKRKRGAITVVLVENNAAKAEISLFGGHVLSFVPKHDNRERLWLSPLALFDKSKPIRGGIPICWPWFGAAPVSHQEQIANLPSHGFVRSQDCELVSTKQLSASSDQIILKPTLYPFKALNLNLELEIIITVGKALSVEVVTQNNGPNSVNFFAAMHSYFKVDSIENVELEGIDSEYLDKTQSMQRMPALKTYIINNETDRVHLGSSPTINIKGMHFRTSIESKGNDSIIVWNPWDLLSKSMLDINDLGYKEMVCVETARTQQGRLGPNVAHTLTQIIR